MTRNFPDKKPVTLFGAALGVGANDPGCAAGPDRILSSALIRALAENSGRVVKRGDVIQDADDTSESKYARVAAVCRELALQVKQSVKGGEFPVVLGGEHTCAIGTWSGVTEALDARGRFGLIWIDAHMDAHTVETLSLIHI